MKFILDAIFGEIDVRFQGLLKMSQKQLLLDLVAAEVKNRLSKSTYIFGDLPAHSRSSNEVDFLGV